MLNQEYSEYLSNYDGELQTMELLYNFRKLYKDSQPTKDEKNKLTQDEKEDLYDLLWYNILLHIIHHFNKKEENQLIKNVIISKPLPKPKNELMENSQESRDNFIKTLEEFRDNFMEILGGQGLLDLDKWITIHLAHEPVLNYPTAHYSFSIQNLIANIQQTSMQQISNTTK